VPTLTSTPASTLAPQPSPAVPGDAFRYWGFISYSQRDAEWAKKLHGFLETYRIPRALIGRKTDAGTIPQRLVPIFRDRDELGGSGDLGATLNETLTESGSLIVICSPTAAASRWSMRRSVSTRRWGRSGRVFPLILAGEPNASDGGDPAAECFPKSLRHVVDRDGVVTDRRAEPLAADARPGKDGWEDAACGLSPASSTWASTTCGNARRCGSTDGASRARSRRWPGCLLLGVAYLGLADADVPVPAGETAAHAARPSRVGPFFRPVISQAEMDGRARSIRGALRTSPDGRRRRRRGGPGRSDLTMAHRAGHRGGLPRSGLAGGRAPSRCCDCSI